MFQKCVENAKLIRIFHIENKETHKQEFDGFRKATAVCNVHGAVVNLHAVLMIASNQQWLQVTTVAEVTQGAFQSVILQQEISNGIINMGIRVF